MSTLSEQNEDKSVTNTSSNMKQEQAAAVENAVSSQNGTNGDESNVIDLSQPVKTEGEASNAENSIIPKSLQFTPTSSASSSSPITPFAPNLGGLSSQLSSEELTAAQKKANLLALSTLAKRGGPNAKDMFTVQQKLQEFLTSLITLAGQKGPKLKLTVQLLVQNLMTGQITEEQFATRIESDLHSQHQPSLLPFLKNSVPHLKTRLQLQQAILKELVQRIISEKNGNTNSTAATATVSSASSTATITTASSTTTPLPTASSSSASNNSNIAAASTSAAPSPSAPPSSSVSASSLVATPTPQASIPAPSLSPASKPSRPSPAIITLTPGGNIKPLGGQGGGVTAAPMVNISQPLNQAVLESLKKNIPKNLLEQIMKLPPDQQKLVFNHQLRQMQQAKAKQQQQQQQQQQEQRVQVTPVKGVREHHQGLVQEQQVPLVVGGGKPGIVGGQGSPVTISVRARSSVAAGVVDQKLKPPSFGSVKVIASSPGGGVSSSSSSTSAVGGKKKGKGKEAAVDAGGDEDEEVGMGILDEVGVNLQEETAQFLPHTVGESTGTRSCKDEVFLNLPVLRQKVGGILGMNGLHDVSDDVLVLLSHATQQRMKDVIEKLTAISQHRVEVLKDNKNYRVQSEVRNQFRVLETIDRIIHKRKQEKEHEQMLRAAKSRSKGADPEKAAKIREEAKQIQQDEAARIRNESANKTALAAIGTRKRPNPNTSDDSAGGGAPSVQAGGLEGSTSAMISSSLFAPLASTRSPKRHVTSRDLIFYMEQERETRKSLALYKTFLK